MTTRIYLDPSSISTPLSWIDPLINKRRYDFYDPETGRLGGIMSGVARRHRVVRRNQHVVELASSYSQTVIARMIGISQPTVHRILRIIHEPIPQP